MIPNFPCYLLTTINDDDDGVKGSFLEHICSTCHHSDWSESKTNGVKIIAFKTESYKHHLPEIARGFGLCWFQKIVKTQLLELLGARGGAQQTSKRTLLLFLFPGF